MYFLPPEFDNAKYRNRLKESSQFPHWLKFRPNVSRKEDDVRFLKLLDFKKIIIELYPKTECDPFGFSVNSLRYLQEFCNFSGLSICNQFHDLKDVEGLKQLECLIVFSIPSCAKEYCRESAVLNLSELTKLTALSIDYDKLRDIEYIFGENNSIKNLEVSNCGGKYLFRLERIESFLRLETLRLFRPKDFNLDALVDLKRLTKIKIDYARNLKDFSVISHLPKLKSIDIENVPNLNNLEFLNKNTSVRALSVQNCGAIDSLKPLANTNIEYLNFFGTTVSDSNLDALMSMPLKQVIFNDKRTYNYKHSDFQRKNNFKAMSISAWSY